MKIVDIKGKKEKISHIFDYEKEVYEEITENELEENQNYVAFADRNFIDDFAKYNINKKFNAKLVVIKKDDEFDVKEIGYIINDEMEV